MDDIHNRDIRYNIRETTICFAGASVLNKLRNSPVSSILSPRGESSITKILEKITQTQTKFKIHHKWDTILSHDYL